MRLQQLWVLGAGLVECRGAMGGGSCCGIPLLCSLVTLLPCLCLLSTCSTATILGRSCAQPQLDVLRIVWHGYGPLNGKGTDGGLPYS